MYIKRIAEQTINSMLSSGKVGIILGARQVGKTTLVEHVLAEQAAVFLNFDIEVDKARFLAAAALSPGDGLRSLDNPPVLVIDEAQRLPETSRIIKGWHDARVPAKFLLLGSSSLNLLDQAAESLTGRNRKLVLPPLLFSEALGGPSCSPQDFRLYRHQEEAVRAAMAEDRNLIVCSGTGSGKTECFLIPIIDHLVRQHEGGSLAPGVRAMILYPMNALVNDQVRRLLP